MFLRISLAGFIPTTILLATIFIGGGFSAVSAAPPACVSPDVYTVADATHTQWFEWSLPSDGDRDLFDFVYTSAQAPRPGWVHVNQIGSFWASKDQDLRGETIDASLRPDAGIDAPVEKTNVVHGALKLAAGCGR